MVRGQRERWTPTTKNYTPHLLQFGEVAGVSSSPSAMRGPLPGIPSLLIKGDSEPGKYEFKSYSQSIHVSLGSKNLKATNLFTSINHPLSEQFIVFECTCEA